MRLPHFLALVLLAIVLPSATAQFGTGNLVFGKPRLVITGDTSPGGTPVNSNVAEDFPAGNLIDVTGVLFLPVIGTNSRSFRVLQV